MNKRSFTQLSLAFGLALSAGLASAAMDNTTLANGKSIYGSSAPASQAGKVVDLNASGQALNIECGEAVTFRNGDKSFSWKFDGVGHRVVDLQAIAPAGFSSKPLKVYVARNDGERT
jgi:hypothetical protein